MASCSSQLISSKKLKSSSLSVKFRTEQHPDNGHGKLLDLQDIWDVSIVKKQDPPIEVLVQKFEPEKIQPELGHSQCNEDLFQMQV